MAAADLIQAVAATAELCGTNLSEAAAKMLVADLAAFDEQAVIVALSKCRREIKGRLTLAEILSRIDDGRPGPQEAWAMLPRDANATVVMTDEMAQAWGLVRSLLSEGERVAARMAFLEAYTRLVTEARNAAKPVRWFASLGFDKEEQQAVITRAVEIGRLTPEHAKALLPAPGDGPMSQFLLTGNAAPLLEAQSPANRAAALSNVGEIKKIIARVCGAKA
ncbi:hypothetical protein KQH60_08165 [Mycetohabitans sp. B8]|uniref:hypothetical protein n=1 Tax=Mycetohabitans sp. B8 TaxID=2841845 RepID=UPI001F3A1371|nr:hypothetical protein [Mycetohabitans sp. B8]MCG1042521.1 hypothetical protein [Mycetohabitans sp. B8]